MLLAAIIGFGVVIIWGDAGLSTLEEVPDIVFGIIVVCVYYIPLEAMSGRTIGKLITGTKVVSEDGHRPPFSEVIKRTLSRFIPFEAFISEDELHMNDWSYGCLAKLLGGAIAEAATRSTLTAHAR